ncbi:ATP-dependent DNA/RNA helicase dhx36 [Clonorchis sinensis]|uniref:ATP-dependent DNA/RNA helicase dhx36 n=1 Tax=Clonorchis sinensis TaxID=79923 RepID=A0A8T1MDU3_CLOSI|nr:ATP-dependent DNA/RNA helicase dhx36 [Clonorchis sinensis]
MSRGLLHVLRTVHIRGGLHNMPKKNRCEDRLLPASSMPDKNNSCRPPPWLRGKEIGLWYAAHSSNKPRKKVDKAATLDMTGINVTRLRNLLNLTHNTSSGPVPAELVTTPDDMDPFDLSERNDPSTTEKVAANPSDDLLQFSDRRTNGVSIESDPMQLRNLSLTRNQELDSTLASDLCRKHSSEAYRQMLQIRQKLPAYVRRKEIIDAVRSNQVVVISGETGCGKTTQIPQLILEDEITRGNGSVTRIVVTQPRRISAISVAERVAAERGETLGSSIGYQVRLDRCYPRQLSGSIMYLTTGMLLQWLHSDPTFQNISHIIVDEVHEREFLCDFLLNVLRDITESRPELRVVIMSATLNADQFSSYFGNCMKLEIPGRLFPVQTFFLEDVLRMTNFYLPKNDLKELAKVQHAYMKRCFLSGDLTKTAARKALDSNNEDLERWLSTQTDLSANAAEILRVVDDDAYPLTDLIVHLIDHLLRTTTKGAILVFVPGIGAIRETIMKLRDLNPRLYDERSNRVCIYALHSQMTLSKQRGLFEVPPEGKRKVIVSTNIAETSVTIEDVVYVIDSGRIKITNYDPLSNTNSLSPVLVSRANAAQRRGRAGRVQMGYCYHLFSRYVHDNIMAEYQLPEMLRMRLEDVILRIKLLDLGPVSTFLASCPNPPDPKAVERTLHFLREIQAIDMTEDSAVQLESAMSKRFTKRPKRWRRDLRARAQAAMKQYNEGSKDMLEEEAEEETPSADISYGELPGDNSKLTPLGEHLARLPMDPQSAKLLILGALFGCLEPALAVAACLNYRDPFEIPLEQQVAATRSRVELSQNSLSDHWVYKTIIENYRQLQSGYDRRKFCDRYFIRENIVKDILRLMDDHATLLYERKYIGTPNPLDKDANRNKDNFPLFRAILCGALFPNILKLMPTIRDGRVKRPKVIARPSEGKISVSPKSVNGNVWASDPVWMVYFTKTRTEKSLNPTVLDTTIIPLRPVLFFSGIIQPTMSSDSTFTVDNWIQVKTSPTVFQLVTDLRKRMDDILESKFKNPDVTDWSPSSSEGCVLKTIIELLVSEPVPIVQTQRYPWEHKMDANRT